MKERTYNRLKSIMRSLYESKYNEEEKKRIYIDYLKSLRKLAYRGNAEAQYDLAQHYEGIGFWGVPNPYDSVLKRFYWYSKAASNNHAAAHNNLADMYERGDGCTQNIKKAAELYKRAAELGDILGKKNYKLLLKQIKIGKYRLE